MGEKQLCLIFCLVQKKGCLGSGDVAPTAALPILAGSDATSSSHRSRVLADGGAPGPWAPGFGPSFQHS